MQKKKKKKKKCSNIKFFCSVFSARIQRLTIAVQTRENKKQKNALREDFFPDRKCKNIQKPQNCLENVKTLYSSAEFL